MLVFLLDSFGGGALVNIQDLIRTFDLSTFAIDYMEEQRWTYLSLNALRIRSTSSSRWNADASRLNSFSISRSSSLRLADDDDA